MSKCYLAQLQNFIGNLDEAPTAYLVVNEADKVVGAFLSEEHAKAFIHAARGGSKFMVLQEQDSDDQFKLGNV